MKYQLLAALATVCVFAALSPAHAQDAGGPKERVGAGDMGIATGAIARSKEQLAILKQVQADRDYQEFKLKGVTASVTVGEIVLGLSELDPQRRIFSLSITTGGRTILKKKRGLYEPLQFYIGERVLCEVIVFSVGANGVAGYLTTHHPVTTAQKQTDPDRQKQLDIWQRNANCIDVAEVSRAAEQGNAPAQITLGNFYQDGDCVPKDYAQSAIWFRKAADQGDADSQTKLGNLYWYGQGVTKDYVQAAIWYRKAADQGNVAAQNGLGNLYRDGQGVTQDYAQAEGWYRKAANQGYQPAKDGLQSIQAARQAATAAGSSSPVPGPGSSPTPAESYNPNRHYSGPGAGMVATLLAKSPGWSCPSSTAASFTYKPPVEQVCMRDSYVIAAVAEAYGAECEARLGRDNEATADAKAMLENVANAKKMCSHALAIGGGGSSCSTLDLVPCD